MGPDMALMNDWQGITMFSGSLYLLVLGERERIVCAGARVGTDSSFVKTRHDFVSWGL